MFIAKKKCVCLKKTRRQKKLVTKKLDSFGDKNQDRAFGDKVNSPNLEMCSLCFMVSPKMSPI